MPYIRPTLEEITQTTIAEIETRLPGADAALRFSNLNILAYVIAGGLHGLYGAANFMADQLFVDSADGDYLNRHGQIWGVGRVAASYANGVAIFVGTAGTIIPANTLVQRSDGFRYVTTTLCEIGVTPFDQANIVATEAGASGNCSTLTALTLVTTIAGVTQINVDINGCNFGADAEADTSYRARIINRIQQPPHGGNANDYVQWALQVPTVTRAWCIPLAYGLGTVGVFFATDNALSVIPSAAVVAQVQSYIDARRPVGALVTVSAPVTVTINFSISGLTPANTAVKNAVEQELKDLLFREGTPAQTIPLSHITEAISNAAGEYDHALFSPSAAVVIPNNGLGVYGGITWL